MRCRRVSIGIYTAEWFSIATGFAAPLYEFMMMMMMIDEANSIGITFANRVPVTYCATVRRRKDFFSVQSSRYPAKIS